MSYIKDKTYKILEDKYDSNPKQRYIILYLT